MNEAPKRDYKATLNLPDTKFPMKANLAQREPERLKWWEENDIYNAMLDAAKETGETFLLHDGPPYANGHLHLGTALNKILKDMIVKSRNMQGYHAPYVPGWDCHGLPIELKVEHELGEKKRTLPPAAVRRRCRQYAQKFLDIQRKEFRRLGVFGQWDKPYMTMDPSYEAATAAELANFSENGSLVRSKKPIYWCCSCQTALAEAEVEYADHTSSSVYVRFPFADKRLSDIFPTLTEQERQQTYIIIWTTTPWTLPANMGVALHPEFTYVLVEYHGALYILAADLLENVAKEADWDMNDVVERGRAVGSQFDRLQARHPFYDRESLLVLGEHVTLEAGTGCVHTAPGHGREDYEVGLQYGLEIYSPLNDQGQYLDSVEFFAGQQVHKANPNVIVKLEEVGNLLAKSSLSHSYPHCWRCKEPVIFRATTQWFIGMEQAGLRQRALKAIREQVKWIPTWGEERIYNMIETRPDWCISRQRTWGVPILALLCESCGEAWNDPAWMRDMAARFAKHPTGCDYWYEAELNDVVPADLVCSKCGGTHWKRETDILDVWFDSGTSFAAVLEQRPELHFPADMYLEGSDQHRGWFHSSLLASMGSRGVAPYKEVLTHGYVVDGHGLKMSKSVGNVIAPDEIIGKYGAEILRMWVSSVDYREDVRISDEILNRLVDAYRRIRNTCKYLLGCLGDLTLDDLMAPEDMDPLDRHILDATARMHARVQQAYLDYEFHKAFHTLHGFCVSELSAFYLDIIKDRAYASGASSKARRSAQSAMYVIVRLLIHSMAPILSFTAEEVYGYIPKVLLPADAAQSIFASRLSASLGSVDRFFVSDEERARWERLLAIRADVTRAIEPLRKSKAIGHSLDTRVTLYLDAENAAALNTLGTDLRAVFIVSQLLVSTDTPPADAVLGEVPGLAVHVERAYGEKCERCWIYSEELGTNAEHPTLCPRCTAVLCE